VVAALGGFPYRPKDWAELNRNLFPLLSWEKRPRLIILTSSCWWPASNPLHAHQLVLEKTKEILHPQVHGARDSSVMKIFVSRGW